MICIISSLIHQVPAGGAKKPGEKGPTEGIEVALNPEELDLDTAAMQAKYDQTMREQQSQIEKEDLSDMVAEHAAKQKVSNCCFLHRKISLILGHFKIWCNQRLNEMMWLYLGNMPRSHMILVCIVCPGQFDKS